MVTLNLSQEEAEILYGHISTIAPCENEAHPDHEQMESVRKKLFRAKDREKIRELRTNTDQ